MVTLTIQGVSEETQESLRLRAAETGRSVEEEVRRILAEHAGPRKNYKNPKTREEIAAAVEVAQKLFAPMRETYSVDQFIAEKRLEAAREYGAFNDPARKFEK